MQPMNIYTVPLHANHPTTYKKNVSNISHAFNEHFQQAIEATITLKISKHANERLIERQISISPEQWQHINEKVDVAQQKGVQQPLVLMDQAALIINAKNRTVITAMNRMEAKEQIFTNIDGTIVL